MSANPSQRFYGITRALFARLRKKASQLGIRVASPKGEAVKNGVTIQWTYDATAQVLDVKCRAPFWINASQADRVLRHEIEVTLCSGRAA